VFGRGEQINQKAAESLADPQEYPNLFPDWELACETEVERKEQRYAVLICEDEWTVIVKLNINLKKSVHQQPSKF